MMRLSILAATSLLLVAIPGMAAEAGGSARDNAIIDAQIAVKEAVEARTKEISIGCNSAPLPTTPVGDTWQLVVDESFFGQVSRYSMTAWRKPCPTEGDFQLMLTLRPTAGPTSLISPLAVEQAGRTFNVMPVVNEANTAFSGNLTATTTVMLQYIGSQSQAFDDEQALTIKVLSLGGPTLNLAIPAAGDAEPLPFVINGRQRGTFYDPSKSGQGLVFDVIEGASPVLVAGWYTASPDPEKADLHEWYTLIGPITGDSATLEIQHTTGQRFMEATPVSTVTVGTARITFTSCTHGTFEYEIPAFGKSGSVPLVRLTPTPQGCD